jgi:alpha-tubulin suppressor-like RCC1 family protein/phosphodiesterase/alkaline phosphatase D-like protein
MRILALIISLAFFHTAGAAPTVGLNFSNSSVSTTIAGGTSDGFSGWTDSRPNGSTTTAHLQSSPLALGTSGVTATWSASGTWSAGENLNKEQTPYRAYLDDGGTGVRVTIQGLSAWLASNGCDSYRIRCYVSSDAASGFQPVSIRAGTSSAGTVLHTMTPPILGNGSFPTGGSVPVGTGVARGHVDSPNTLTADEITLTLPVRPAIGNPNRNVRGTLAAFKITAFKAQTIAFGEVAPATVGDAPVALSASASSGLPVAITSSNPAVASISGTTLSFHAAGTVTLTARQAGNGDFLPAPEVQRTLRVYSGIKLPQTITFNDPGDPVHGDAPIVLSASAGSGLPLIFTSSDLAVATIEDGRLIARFPGTTIITASQPGDLEFAPATPVTHEVTVSPGILTLPASVARTLPHDAGPLTVDIPVSATSGGTTSWWAGFESSASWVRVTGNGGTTPGVLRVTLDPSGVAPGIHETEIFINAGSLRFRVPLRLTVTTGSPVDTFDFTAAGHVPVTAGTFEATGRFVSFKLRHAPAVGNSLKALELTGAAGIGGAFANLAQGQRIDLEFGGVRYPFVANYHGGNGNDLMLEWAHKRIHAWGNNSFGPYGSGDNLSNVKPAPLILPAVLAGKTISALSGGADFTLMLFSDGTLASVGVNDSGQLGNNQSSLIYIPSDITNSGVLAGKRVVAISAGERHGLALCSDGTVASWGYNLNGQLGNGTTTLSRVPIAVDSGALAGKRAVAVAAASTHSMALLADGTVVAWGENGGQLGNGSTANSLIPVAVDASGVLAGKVVTAIGARWGYGMALCSDGTLANWGAGWSGSLGNGSTANSNVPVAVSTSGVLAGRTVTALAPGYNMSLVMCSDGAIAGWGYNGMGSLGNGTSTDSNVPVRVKADGVLGGKTPVIVAASYPGFALCSDGTLATWGDNQRYQFGNGTNTGSNVPVTASSENLGQGEKFIDLMRGNQGRHMMAIAALPMDSNARLASLQPGSAELGQPFDPARTSYQLRVRHATASFTLNPALANPRATLRLNGVVIPSGSATGPLSAAPGETYHLEVTAEDGVSRTTYVLTVAEDSTLSGLALSSGVLRPEPSPFVANHVAYVPRSVTSVRVTPTATDPTASITVGGAAVGSGEPSQPIAIAEGPNLIEIRVTTVGGAASTYRVTVVRQIPLVHAFNSAASVAVTAAGHVALANTAELSLGFAPPPGTSLTVADVSGPEPILGEYGNLPHGGIVGLEHDGILYRFMADYFGGDGNDLVLHWVNSRIFAWGSNDGGQLGLESSTANRLLPEMLPETLLAGNPLRTIDGGSFHSVALTIDGRLFAWGSNGSSGRLGNNSTASSPLPVAVDVTGVLAGKRVVRVASGDNQSLALCEDGTFVRWGTSSTNRVPEAIPMTGALEGKRVARFAVGQGHSVALCTDGTLVSWGSNSEGQLGNNSTVASEIPVSVVATALAGKTVTRVAAGNAFSLALCSDGSLFSWGSNSSGQLGNGNFTRSTVPVAVNRGGVLAGKTAVEIATGSSHALVRCSDGTLVSWGFNFNGQLGNQTTTDSANPVLVLSTGVLAGKTVRSIDAGGSFSIALCSDGSLATWGHNFYGQLGISNTTQRTVPVLAQFPAIAGGRLFAASTGNNHVLAVMAIPPAPAAETLAAGLVSDFQATLHARAFANGSSTRVWFEYGLTPAYGGTIEAAPSPLSGRGGVAVSASLDRLIPGTTYHYRVVVSNGTDTIAGENRTFTTTTGGLLADLSASGGDLLPGFSSATAAYSVTVASDTTAIRLQATAAAPGAVVRVQGDILAAGADSAPVALPAGNTVIPVSVTAADGTTVTTYTITVTRLPARIEFASAGDAVPTAAAFDLSGKTLELALGFAPPVGVDLPVLRQTGITRIRGDLENLPHGGLISLEYGGRFYPYVVNYHGGDGDDLVLQWAEAFLSGWGSNSSGQVGDRTQASRFAPVPVFAEGVLAGRTVLSIAGGANHTLALCADGTLAAWGSNNPGMLGIGSITGQSLLPVEVDRSGALAGKTVVAIAAGAYHNLALCRDGSLFSWGSNSSGELGVAGVASSGSPLAIPAAGALAGKEVVAIAAGTQHSLALCGDGTLAAWGRNQAGQLGDGSTGTDRHVPVQVGQGSVLQGRRVIAIAASGNHNLVLCDDGGLVAWGENSFGQLGDGTRINRALPVSVKAVGALSGRSPLAIGTANGHSTVLCNDGAIVTWGTNNSGRLGNGSTTDSLVPVKVVDSGPLAGRPPVLLACGGSHTHALAADGTLVAWGNNGGNGSLGNGDSSSFSSNVPVAVNTALVPVEGRFSRVWSGSSSMHGLALVATPARPIATTAAAAPVRDRSATLRGRVLANGADSTVWFEYGLTEALTETVSAVPATLGAGAPEAEVAADLGGLLSGKTYHFRVVASNAGGIRYGETRSFTTGDNAALADLATSTGRLSPAFDKSISSYVVTVAHGTPSIQLTPRAVHETASIRVNGVTVSSGSSTAAIPLMEGNTPIPIEVRSADESEVQHYRVVVTRLPAIFAFPSASSVPVTVERFAADGILPEIRLAFAPVPGTGLMLVRGTGGVAIDGEFSNLAQGQVLVLLHEGIEYSFVANYHGGDGNNLVLEWANRRLLAWGTNNGGQLGNGTLVSATLPGEVPATGALEGRVVLSLATGPSHVLALCADGTIAAWGNNAQGQLGDGSQTSRSVPVAVDRSGVLAGKRVVRLANGGSHSLALCSDGSLVAWGSNSSGQLGLPVTTPRSTTPVVVAPSGALSGRTVVGIGAGEVSSYAVLSDGAVAAWGGNADGQIGNDNTLASHVPVRVHRDGVLAGKSVVAVAGGFAHAVALCSDGTLAVWGSNQQNQLGTTANTTRKVPYAVDRSGVLAGKTVTSIAAGTYHSLALCSDGTLVSWGRNSASELGNGNFFGSSVPVAVVTSGVLSGKRTTAISAGGIHSLVLNDDASAAAWGTSLGSLGDGVSTSSTVPVAVSRANLRAGERIVALAAGSSFSQMLVASPPKSSAATLAASAIRDSGATLNAEVRANGSETGVSFEYGLAGTFTRRVTAGPATTVGVAATRHQVVLTGLLAGTAYQYRVISTGPGGTVFGETLTFTTTSDALLTDLRASGGELTPRFAPNDRDFAVTLSHATASSTVTAFTSNPGATVRINGSAVPSGSASAAIPLAPGDTVVPIEVDANDGINSRSYRLTFTRLPELIDLDSPAKVPVSVERLRPTGLTLPVTLGHAPSPGARLTLIRVTGDGVIDGNFENMPQGETIVLHYGGIAYPFVVHYFCGDGNDLVLVPLHGRLLGWGNNSQRQLSPVAENSIGIPRNLDPDGIFSGKALIDVASGARQSLALFADGSLYQWRNQFENPERIDSLGVLAGRRVIAIASGDAHSLAICDDGTLAAWGSNDYGQFGNNSTDSSTLPVAVDRSGVLAGKRVVSVAAGFRHSVALCSDGTIAAWGFNGFGQLGNGSTADSRLPVIVAGTGLPASAKTVAVESGVNFNLALMDDGSMIAWGINQNGNLGDGTTVNRPTPVTVDRSGALAGKTITAISAGGYHCAALCSDGTLATWGYNYQGRLGDGTSDNRLTPVAIQTRGVLAGRTVTAIELGNNHSLALCSDRTLASWGSNEYSALGNTSAGQSLTPSLVNASTFAADESVVRLASGPLSASNLIHLAGAPGPVASTLAASNIQDTFATLNSEVVTNRNLTRVIFEYGLTPDYGQKVVVEPDLAADAAGVIPVSATVDGLLSGTTYHFRVVVSGPLGTTLGSNRTFTTTTRGALAELHLSAGSVTPHFNGAITHYRGTAPFAADELRVTPVAATGTPVITVNGVVVPSGSASGAIPLEPGLNTIEVKVAAADGINRKTYTITLRRLPLAFEFRSPTEVPLTDESFTAAGDAPPVTLHFPPGPGTVLTLVQLTGTGLIEGTFANLVPGQIVPLTFGNTTYHFAADYGGGSGNDLVLQWVNQRPIAWGSNFMGQLGNGSKTASTVPVPVAKSGVLAGRTIVGLAASMTNFSEYGFSLALTADGRVASWGNNDRGQLGTGSGGDESSPTWVDTSGALAGRRVIDIAAGEGHSLALCSDGTMVAWGNNASNGQLGDGSNVNRYSPVIVRMTGALAGKKVVAIAAGGSYNLALCEDGTLVSWGNGGVRGDNSTVNRALPGTVDQTGVLAGRKVVAIAAGGGFAMALCEDGALAAWGFNGDGQIGDGTKTNALVPVLVQPAGALEGRTIVRMAGGSRHAMALCSDGTLVAWGNNTWGQLGDGGTTASLIPVRVDTGGVLAGKSISEISAARLGGLALCSDGTLAAWGQNDKGQIGDASTTQRNLPAPVNTGSFFPGERFILGVSSASAGSHALGLTAAPLPIAQSLAASAITGTAATLNGIVNPLGNLVSVSIEYGTDATYGRSVDATPSSPSGADPVAVSATITGLPPGTLHHYRIVATCEGGVVRSEGMTFTTLSDNARLASLGHDGGAIAPDFEALRFRYVSTVPFTTSSVRVSAVTQHPGARFTVNGQEPSLPVSLAVGNQTLQILVTAEDGETRLTYPITITRLPQVLSFGGSDTVPVRAEGFTPDHLAANLRLDHHPRTGSSLTVVDNTSLDPIHGSFSNLTQGQRIVLPYQGVDYAFVANYFGGTGNDLVLHWADTRLTAWGLNNYGQLGDGSTVLRSIPVAVDPSGLLAGKTILAVSGGYLHTLALCSDGTLAAWGYNVHGQLGNHGNSASPVPLAVNSSGALAGKTVVAISAGPYHNLVLCADGTVAAWGYNNYGQLGTGDTVTRRNPVIVEPLGALAGKRVIAVAAGAYHSLALCSDGTVAGWGYNDEGELGDGSTARRMIPVATDHGGVLAGRKVAMIRSGQYHTLARCTDGTVVSWGYNPRGQLGDGSTANRLSPVEITGSGALGGRTVIDLAAGGSHSFALCSDGTLAAWGHNQRSQLGGGSGQSAFPVPVGPMSSAVRIAAGSFHGLSLAADGSLRAWGDSASGQLGVTPLPPTGGAAAPDPAALHPESIAIGIAAGPAAAHNLAILALPAAGAPAFDDLAVSPDEGPIPALLRDAFGLAPDEANPSRLPQPRLENGRLVARFARPAGGSGVVYGAEWSTTLQEGSWVDIPNTGSADLLEFITPRSDEPSLFMRLKVTRQPQPPP